MLGSTTRRILGRIESDATLPLPLPSRRRCKRSRRGSVMRKRFDISLVVRFAPAIAEADKNVGAFPPWRKFCLETLQLFERLRRQPIPGGQVLSLFCIFVVAQSGCQERILGAQSFQFCTRKRMSEFNSLVRAALLISAGQIKSRSDTHHRYLSQSPSRIRYQL